MQSRGLLQHCLQQHLSVPSQVLGGPYRRVPQAVPLSPLPLSPPQPSFSQLMCSMLGSHSPWWLSSTVQGCSAASLSRES